MRNLGRNCSLFNTEKTDYPKINLFIPLITRSRTPGVPFVQTKTLGKVSFIRSLSKLEQSFEISERVISNQDETRINNRVSFWLDVLFKNFSNKSFYKQYFVLKYLSRGYICMKGSRYFNPRRNHN